ncbi:hypothetical protein GCM10011344_41980 [Dokdonia pacifica]|uniref:CHAT domain-containing protein n=1 Tax=Dokdonia pacifica TaxID=1627892 RepID=A0A239DL86_9FLAO|nr:CHAT domain-containing protein [Dokdonia pacifica]GGG36765.1 hypothetical protein GCM10011344_41980 [Dokdonia pacifica]SNS32453.1 CHAT domain-containing protein [Dokdonia pacifica]
MIFPINSHKKNHLGYFKIVIWVVFLFNISITAQESNNITSILNSSSDSKQKELQLISLFNTLEKNNTDSLYTYYQKAAHWFSIKNDIQNAIIYEQKAFNNISSSKETDSLIAQKSVYTLGNYYRSNYQFKKAIESYHKSINFHKSTPQADKAYLGIAYTYYRAKDFYKSDLYYKTLIERLESKSPSPFLADVYCRAAINLIQTNTDEGLERGITYAKKADEISKLVETPKTIQYRIKYRLGYLYNTYKTLNINLSETYYKEALQIAIDLNDSSKIRKTYLDLGNLHQTTNLNTALAYDQIALKITPKKDSLTRHKITSNIGFANSYFGKYPEGLTYAFDALHILTLKDFKNHTDDYQKIFLASPYKQNILTQLSILAQTYLRYYEETKDPVLLEKCIAYFTMGDQLIDLLKVDSSEFTSRLFWRNVSTSIYGKAIRACYLHQDLEKAHYFIEKNKALLLMEDLASQAYKRSLTISPEIIAQEEVLQREILEQEKLLKTQAQTSGTNQGSNLYGVLVEKKRALEQLRENMLPEKQLSFEPSIIALSELQKSLKPDEVIVNYHLSNDDGYGIYSNNNKGYISISTSQKNKFFEIENTNALQTDIQLALTFLKRPFKTQEDITRYTQLSNSIYKKLFPTEEVRSQIKNKKLIISPDSYLSFLPFEALSTSADKTSYLIQNTEIRYVYSNSFIRNIHREVTPQKHTYLGIAPVQFQDTQLTSLDYSLQEINSIDAYYPGDKLLQEKGTKQAFLDALNQHTIIHLATHADISDTTSPWIAFQDEKITLEELYLTENNAALVFLSGCNTTLGDHKAGEGVMSLARGFFYSGAQSVISTLWSIDDKSTAYITDQFYKNLNNGLTTSEALHHSKKSYLQQHSGSETSPYYWASPILLGKDNTLLIENTTLDYWILISCSLLVMGVIFIYTLSRKRISSKK